jgi:hypothetical protein
MLDISTLAVADTAAIHLKGPDGSHLYSDGKPVRIVLYSPGSPVFAEIEDRQVARATKRMQDNDGKLALVPIEQRDNEQADDLAALTVAFENFDLPSAAEKHGNEKFKALYLDRKLGFIKEQMLKALRDWGKFTQTSTGV